MGERLREVAEQHPAAGVHLLGQQAEVVGVRGGGAEDVVGPVGAAAESQALGQPEGADQEAARVARPPPDDPPGSELAGDGLDGSPHPLVGRGEEADQGKQEDGGVQVVGAERAGVGAGALAPRLVADRGPQLLPRRSPRRGVGAGSQVGGQVDGAVQGDPAHDLGGGVVPLRVPGLPHPGVGLLPRLRGAVGEGHQHLLHRRLELAERLPQDVRGVEHLTQDVELFLSPRVVADPHGPAAPVAGQVR